MALQNIINIKQANQPKILVSQNPTVRQPLPAKQLIPILRCNGIILMLPNGEKARYRINYRTDYRTE